MLSLELQSEFHLEQPIVDKISDNSKTTPVLPSPPYPTANACYRCGGDSHATHNCRFKDQTLRKGVTPFKSLALKSGC